MNQTGMEAVAGSAGTAHGGTLAELAAASRGDEGAFWSLWEEHQAGLFQICLHEMRGNRAEAEDALGQAMLKAHKALPAHATQITALKPWLSRLARNLCVDIHRRRRLAPQSAEALEVLVESEPGENSWTNQNPEEAMMAEETRHGVLKALDTLPAALREPVQLVCMDQLSSQAAAARLGLTPGAVRKRVQMARQVLRQRLQAGQPEPAPGNRGKTMPLAFVSSGASALEIPPPGSVPLVVPVALGCGVRRHFRIFIERRAVRKGSRTETLRRALLRQPQSWEKRAQLAELLYQGGLWSEAVELWLELFPRHRAAVGLGMRLAGVLNRLGRRAEAETVWLRTLSLTQTQAARHHVDGLMKANQRDYERASQAMRLASELEPENAAHFYRRAGFLLRIERAGEALAALDQAVARHPEALSLRLLRAEALRACGRFHEARLVLEPALESAPEDPLILLELADCLLAEPGAGRDAGRRVRTLLRRALRLAPDLRQARECLASYQFKSGSPAEGLACFQDYAAGHPNCARGWAQLAAWLRRAGKHAEAGAAAVRAGELLAHPQAPCTGACEARPG